MESNTQDQKSKISLKSIVVLIVFAITIWYFFGGGLEKQADRNMQTIENKVALDAEKQYQIAKNNGSAMDAYVQAGMVAASYLQAKDETNYKKWKGIEADEAKSAGIPTE